jgi:hypothetical protein
MLTTLCQIILKVTKKQEHERRIASTRADLTVAEKEYVRAHAWEDYRSGSRTPLKTLEEKIVPAESIDIQLCARSFRAQQPGFDRKSDRESRMSVNWFSPWGCQATRTGHIFIAIAELYRPRWSPQGWRPGK